MSLQEKVIQIIKDTSLTGVEWREKYGEASGSLELILQDCLDWALEAVGENEIITYKDANGNLQTDPIKTGDYYLREEIRQKLKESLRGK